MISTLFKYKNNSNFIYILIYAVVILCFNEVLYEQKLEWKNAMGIFCVWVVFIANTFLLSFIALQSDLPKKGQYYLLLFALLFLYWVPLGVEIQLIVAQFCYLQFIRKIISLYNNKNLRKKVFDATLWVIIGGLFYKWMIIYLLIVIFFAIKFSVKQYKTVFVPFVAIFLGLIIFYSIPSNYMDKPSLIQFFQMSFVIPVTFTINQQIGMLFLTILISLGGVYIFKLKTAQNKALKSRLMVLFFLTLFPLVFMFLNVPLNSIFLFCCAPISLILHYVCMNIKRGFVVDVFVVLMFIITIGQHFVNVH